MPFKLNQDRRHHIPKQKRRVQNWREYDASLRQRGSLTVWFSDTAIEGWRAAPRTTPDGQPWYSPLAILTALTLRAVFRLALRQTDGLIGSVLHPRGLALALPDHTSPLPPGRVRPDLCPGLRCLAWIQRKRVVWAISKLGSAGYSLVGKLGDNP